MGLALLAVLLIQNLASTLNLGKLMRKAVKRMKKIIKRCVAYVPAAVKLSILHTLMAASS